MVVRVLLRVFDVQPFDETNSALVLPSQKPPSQAKHPQHTPDEASEAVEAQYKERDLTYGFDHHCRGLCRPRKVFGP